jgi:hypothetical protein
MRGLPGKNRKRGLFCVHCSGILDESSASSLVELLWNGSVMSSFNMRNSSRGVCGSSELCPASKMGTLNWLILKSFVERPKSIIQGCQSAVLVRSPKHVSRALGTPKINLHYERDFSTTCWLHIFVTVFETSAKSWVHAARSETLVFSKL